MLKQTGAEDVASAGEAGADYAKTDKPLPRRSTGTIEREPEVQRMAAGSYRPVGEYDDDFRRDFESRYQGRGFSYEEYEPAYRFGSSWADDDRYRDSDWYAVEPEARRSWEARGRGRWEDARDAIRYGWERARRRV
jgi:hypothetical protein